MRKRQRMARSNRRINISDCVISYATYFLIFEGEMKNRSGKKWAMLNRWRWRFERKSETWFRCLGPNPTCVANLHQQVKSSLFRTIIVIISEAHPHAELCLVYLHWTIFFMIWAAGAEPCLTPLLSKRFGSHRKAPAFRTSVASRFLTALTKSRRPDWPLSILAVHGTEVIWTLITDESYRYVEGAQAKFADMRELLVGSCSPWQLAWMAWVFRRVHILLQVSHLCKAKSSSSCRFSWSITQTIETRPTCPWFFNIPGVIKWLQMVLMELKGWYRENFDTKVSSLGFGESCL